jgi:hypothetical protein
MGEVVQLEIFAVNTVDPPWRDNKDAMEYPFLSLQKAERSRSNFGKVISASGCVHRQNSALPPFGIGI